MPVHDWTKVDAGLFHHFHLSWIAAIGSSLNSILPPDYYALTEQFVGERRPDVLALKHRFRDEPRSSGRQPKSANTDTLLAPPKTRYTAETEMEFYQRKQRVVTIRHVSDDELIAVVEVVSPGNKSGRQALQSFLDKAAGLLHEGIHLLILDLLPPGRRDPHGIHFALWEEITGEECSTPPDKPLTLAAYDAEASIRAFVEPVAVGDRLPDMPLFLKYNACVHVPIEATYQTAVEAVPRRWRDVLESATAN